MMQKRRGLIVWLSSLKYAKQLRKFGNVLYVSKKMKYAVVYTDEEIIERLKEQLESLYFVKKVDMSLKPDLKTEYQNAKPDKAKEYDYKMN
ncbi:YlbG family protein [Massilibacterium senegalense]|uniref:YlbG family protein n=1 Tax=Massilibacterium senegalense TaxID=1632858 RepID=UPI0007836E10|nr:DUF2129 domain-containing protein [Massilibacterium senegalense]